MKTSLVILLALVMPSAAQAQLNASARTDGAAGRASASAARGTAAVDHAVRFADSVRDRRFDDAEQSARTLLAEAGESGALIDALTFQLLTAGGSKQAARLLMRAYPFAVSDAKVRQSLLARIGVLLQQDPSAFGSADLAVLRVPLDNPAMRQTQAALWAAVGDCEVVRAVLGDLSAEYGYDDLMRLGDCASEAGPEVALEAYRRAHAAHPGRNASRALAYLAHAQDQYAVALEAWRSVERLQAAERLAAVTTALAAGEAGQAALWLAEYGEQQGPANERYWRLAAETRLAQGDRPGAAQALDRAMEWSATAADFQHLAQLRPEPERQVDYLARALELEPTNARAALEFAYALDRAGREAQAHEAFRRAVELDPTDAGAQMALGYGYWRRGEVRQSTSAFERAITIQPENGTAAEQLVYAYQRLGNAEEARWFARRAIDASRASNGGSAAPASAERLFGLRRLHEDLGRRVTVAFDAWSGTRVGAGTSITDVGFRSYSQAELEYRMVHSPGRGGRILAAYARVIADGGAAGRAAPLDNETLGFGARWKPLRTQVFYLAAEHQRRADGTRQDLLLRASASFLGGGAHSDDWHPGGRGWFAQTLYVDAGHFVDSEQSLFASSYRASYHAKVGGRQSVEPYAQTQVNALNTTRLHRDARAGAGLRWNLWHGESLYNAPRHKLTVGVEIQHAFTTYLNDRTGLFLSIGSRW